jgi:hypothetical protein
MSCDEIRALFSDAAEARLAAGEQAAWDTHLATCPDCRREWASFQRTLGLLQGLPRHRAPTGFVDRVMAAADPPPWPRRLARRLFVPVRVKVPLEAAALALLALTGVYLVQRTPEMHQAMRDAAPPSYPPAVPAEPGALTVPAPAAPAESPASSAPPPGVSRQDRGGVVAKPEEAPAEAKGRAEQAAVSDTAPEKAPAQELTPPPASPEPRTREVTQPAAPGVQAPSRERSSGSFARQERVSKTAAAAPMVAGRLTVENRDAAVPALTALVAKVGATEISRTVVDDGTVIEVDVPRSRYAEFTQGLAAIGGWTPREERSGPGAEVRMRVIIGPSPR